MGKAATWNDPVAAAAREVPERAALAEGSMSLSYNELDGRVEAWSRWLEEKGAGPTARVAVHLPPSAAQVTLVHAIWRTGAAVCPLHSDWTADESRQALGALDPDLVVEAAADEVASDGQGLRVLPRRRCRPGEGRGPEEERMALLIRTSGTDGRPRGVALSWENLAASARGARERLELGPDDRWLLSLHPAHVGGAALLHRAAWTGAELVTTGSFRPGSAAELVDSGRVSHLSLVPVMLERLMSARGEAPPPDTLRLILLGGQAAPPSLLRRSMEAGYPVATTYGLTEATSQVATAPPSLAREALGTAGPPLPGVEVGAGGEIRVRGPTVALGTVEEGAPGVEPLADDDGWLATGDVGRLDEDGCLWVTGRLSRRIISGGVTVDPAEIEAALDEVSGVGAVHVVGRPDPQWGERPEAVVEPAPNPQPAPATSPAGDPVAGAEAAPDTAVAPDGTMAPEAAHLPARLEAHANAHLSPAKRPRAYHVVDALPRTATGKVDGRAVERFLEEGAP